MNCIVRGCRKKLDENGIPLEYCDYQQGRCPMQRQNREVPKYVLTSILISCIVIAVLLGYLT